MLKFLAWPSVAASGQKTTCAFGKHLVFGGCVAALEQIGDLADAGLHQIGI
jgi:hypothetical protein